MGPVSFFVSEVKLGGCGIGAERPVSKAYLGMPKKCLEMDLLAIPESCGEVNQQVTTSRLASSV